MTVQWQNGMMFAASNPLYDGGVIAHPLQKSGSLPHLGVTGGLSLRSSLASFAQRFFHKLPQENDRTGSAGNGFT